jgi:hypothetical protein
VFLQKQDMKQIPFEQLYQKVDLAAKMVTTELEDTELKQYEDFISKKEREYLDTHEAPDEGALREEFPFIPSYSKETIEKKKLKAKEDAFKLMSEKLGLKNKAAWLLPQITAYIAKMKLTRNAEGKIDSLQFLKDNFSMDDWHKGLYIYCTAPTRGLIVPKQNSADFCNYSALVPLLMMPFKKFDRIAYSEWDFNVSMLLDPHLADAMTCEEVLELDSDQIIACRDLGLVVATGPAAGTLRSPSSTHKLYGNYGEEIKRLPWYCQVMATQIWVAHPSIRTHLMVLDWLNWDKMPQPLIDIEVLPTTESKYRNKPAPVYTSDLPWEN